MIPLLRGYPPGAVFSWHRGEPVSVEAFERAARSLAARLPRRSHVVNLCEDRYAFVLAYAASLLAKQTTLLPPSRAAEAVRESSEGHDAYTLTDEEVLRPGEASASEQDLAHEDTQLPAIVFTSGSTGRPVPHAKTWGSLAAGARAFGERLGLRGAGGVVGTIPPQHMFGLESTVMLPLQNGLAIHPGRPLLPADLADATAALPGPRWLMTSPLSLRACVAAGQALPGLAGVVSSTMPLDPQLARDAERLWQAPIHEIYGSSEAGMIAMRRGAVDETWQLCPGVALTQRNGEYWVQGGHILAAQRIADELEPRGERSFRLLGRKASLVKIAGKRTSLEALNAALNRIDGVRDGVFYLQDGAERVGAVVVAPGRSATELRAELRRHIDPAFLPRPLHLAAALPRGENGKLTRQALLQLIATLESCSIPEDHPALPGHFPGAPVVPGVLLLQEVVRLAGGGKARFPTVKFHAPLGPGEEFRCRIESSGKFTVVRGETLIVSGTLERA